ncbi:hypothetical protein CRI93_13850 [Longimonas halophila]|uniref:Uncharacterized protein n=2 Tax=Longimonas halophila TaxID=1469170 RepID=A0A2H3NI80_9BACT|nr:hypothetical protein CRI93_13850 [Longimonas halophila]
MAVLLLVGCDTVASEQADPEPPASNTLVEMLNAELELTAAQQHSLREHDESVSLSAFGRFTNETPSDAAPGVLWTVAADLHETLTDAQKERLFERNRALRRELRSEMRDGPRGAAWSRLPRGVRQVLRKSLTDAQQEELRALHRELRSAIRDARNQLQEGTLSPEQFRTNVQELRTGFREDARAVLTDAQRERIQAIREAAAERRAERTAARTTVLNLTDAQQEAIGTARQDTRERIRTIRIEQISGARDRDEARQAIRDVRSAMHETLRETLTDVQYETIRLHRSLVLRVRARLVNERRG